MFQRLGMNLFKERLRREWKSWQLTGGVTLEKKTHHRQTYTRARRYTPHCSWGPRCKLSPLLRAEHEPNACSKERVRTVRGAPKKETETAKEQTCHQPWSRRPGGRPLPQLRSYSHALSTISPFQVLSGRWSFSLQAPLRPASSDGKAFVGDSSPLGRVGSSRPGHQVS